jgi:drug/metabolite transporter (DMT)-like permease
MPRRPHPDRSPLAPLGLLTAAFAWGVIWYPYRLLQAAGLSGGLSTLCTYLIGLALALVVFRRELLPPRGRGAALLAMALASGWTNLAYVLGVIQGEVMRVMLLFYLAPLWTVLFARLLLHERPHLFGYLVIALSLAGACVMLYRADGRLPLPSDAAEWLGLSAGLGFALANVLSRRLRHVPIGTRTVWVFAGVAIVAGFYVLGQGDAVAVVGELAPPNAGLLVGIGLALVVATVAVQYGLAHTPANRAIVILLTELAVAAVSSWALAGESMHWREWVGGAMIVAASLMSGRVEKEHV